MSPFTQKIRPLALAILQRGDEILVQEGYDPQKNELFYRLLGGGIEFGEYGQAAIVREIDEELGASLVDVRYLTTLENIFTYVGMGRHEIVLLYGAKFTDESLYQQDSLPLKEGLILTHAYWKPITLFTEQQAPLYPNGTLEFLLNHA
jgi:8-oxo-dGTP pyrophosphatase MutT (NUDIX family)